LVLETALCNRLFAPLWLAKTCVLPAGPTAGSAS